MESLSVASLPLTNPTGFSRIDCYHAHAGLIQSKGTLKSEQYAYLSVISVCKLRVLDID